MDVSKDKLNDMMRKITALLARADHPNTPAEEADSARAMAERLMIKYRIEETELIDSGALADEAHRPGNQRIDLCPSGSPYLNHYWWMAQAAARHAGCRIQYDWRWDADGGTLVAVVVGYEADIRFMELLYTNARLIFGDRMEPKFNAAMSDEDNVYRMRSAGMERIRIAGLMGWGQTGSATAKVTNTYKRACRARGEDPILTGRGNSVTAYRDTYATAFTTEFSSRLRMAAAAADSEATGKELVLASRSDSVDAEFYRMYPNLDPANQKGVATTKGKGRRRGWTKADEARYNRQFSAAGQAGAAAGRRAAAEVDLGAKKKGRIES